MVVTFDDDLMQREIKRQMALEKSRRTLCVHEVLIKRDTSQEEVKAWCKENLVGLFYEEQGEQQHHYYIDDVLSINAGCRIYFSNEQIALLFKLRFG